MKEHFINFHEISLRFIDDESEKAKNLCENIVSAEEEYMFTNDLNILIKEI